MVSSDRQVALEGVHDAIRRCRDCGLCQPGQRYVPGEGPAEAQVVFIGEAPGAEEDRQGRPFVGASGQVLTRLLAQAGLDRAAVFITSVVKCRPPDNRAPTATEIAVCQHHLDAQLAVLQPRVICPLGRIAAQARLGKGFSISREHAVPRRLGEVLYVPLYHPAAALHQARLLPTLEADMSRLRAILAEELGEPARR